MLAPVAGKTVDDKDVEVVVISDGSSARNTETLSRNVNLSRIVKTEDRTLYAMVHTHASIRTAASSPNPAVLGTTNTREQPGAIASSQNARGRGRCRGRRRGRSRGRGRDRGRGGKSASTLGERSAALLYPHPTSPLLATETKEDTEKRNAWLLLALQRANEAANAELAVSLATSTEHTPHHFNMHGLNAARPTHVGAAQMPPYLIAQANGSTQPPSAVLAIRARQQIHQQIQQQLQDQRSRTKQQQRQEQQQKQQESRRFGQSAKACMRLGQSDGPAVVMINRLNIEVVHDTPKSNAIPIQLFNAASGATVQVFTTQNATAKYTGYDGQHVKKMCRSGETSLCGKWRASYFKGTAEEADAINAAVAADPASTKQRSGRAGSEHTSTRLPCDPAINSSSNDTHHRQHSGRRTQPGSTTFIEGHGSSTSQRLAAAVAPVAAATTGKPRTLRKRKVQAAELCERSTEHAAGEQVAEFKGGADGAGDGSDGTSKGTYGKEVTEGDNNEPRHSVPSKDAADVNSNAEMSRTPAKGSCSGIRSRSTEGPPRQKRPPESKGICPSDLDTNELLLLFWPSGQKYKNGFVRKRKLPSWASLSIQELEALERK